MSKLLADKKKLFDIDKDNLMFHNKALFALLIPIVVEQLLNSFMGMVDTMMVSNLGSQAISGVSLVDSVNKPYRPVILCYGYRCSNYMFALYRNERP